MSELFTMSREHPILFTGPNVRLIREKLKTETRRVVYPQPYGGVAKGYYGKHPFCPSCFKGTPAEGMRIVPEGTKTWLFEDFCGNIVGERGSCPWGLPGDRLWVRETWGYHHGYVYRSTDEGKCCPSGGWKPSIHMKREAARTFLDIEKIHMERLQDIPEEGAVAEGVERVTNIGPCRVMGWKDYGGGPGFLAAEESYKSLWDSINGAKHPWKSNPLVWVVRFRLDEKASR